MPPPALAGGPGTLADGDGTGWRNLSARGTWRPAGLGGAHIVDFGVQQDDYELLYPTFAIPGNWIADAPGALASSAAGKTRLSSVFAQDAWTFAKDWKTVLGLRAEEWRAEDGVTVFSPTSSLQYPSRKEQFLSPKAALSYQANHDLVFKASTGRAVRMPTVAELYGATATANSQFINDPNLAPESSQTTELTAEREVGNGLLRLTFFGETTRNALYSQTVLDPQANRNITRVQNVGRIETRGVELVYTGNDVVIKGLDLNASVTYADSVIKANDGFVVTPGDTIGKQQPNIPQVARHRTGQLSLRRALGRFARHALQRHAVPDAEQRRHQRLHVPGCQQVLHRRRAHPLQGHAPVVGGLRHRQPQQRQVLELPPLSAAQLQRRGEVRPVKFYL